MGRGEKGRGSAQAAKRSLQAVILCGGAGSRLRAVLPGLPKALAPVGGKPFLDHVLHLLVAAGIRDVVLCVGVHGDAIREYCRLNAAPGISLVCSQEGKPLGTGGALKHAEELICSDPFLLLNGDTFLDMDMPAFVAQHRASKAAITMALTSVKDATRYGTVQVATDNRITRFREKPTAACLAAAAIAAPENAVINAGCYLMNINILRKIREAPPAVSLEREILPAFIGKGLYGYRSTGFFIDIGVPEDLQRAQTDLPGRLTLAAAHTG